MSQQKDIETLEYISEKFKKLREIKGVSQLDVLNDTGIHIARIETGKVNISVSTLAVLCKYFDINLSEYFKEF